MFNKKLHLTFFSISISIASVFSQSPKNLTSDVNLTTCAGCSDFPPDAYFSTQTQVLNAFNFARRAEETQFSLTANSLGTLTLPVNYSFMSVEARALYILNAERTARAGINYSGNVSLGLPLEGIETHLSTISQNHTQDMITNNFFAHVSPTTGLSPYQRIDNSGTYSSPGTPGGCRGFMTYAENIYVSCDGSTTTPTYTVEQAMFGWIYQDNGSSWGHRKAALIQKTDFYGGVGFTNDVGSSLSEGHLGIGIGTRPYVNTAYPACGGTFNAHIVTMNIADPIPSCIANYTLPIELLSFTGIYTDPYVHLKWVTASEKNNAYFMIERSANGRDFEKFSEVKGFGQSNEQINYTLDDITPFRGVNYYRLVQVDIDGKQSISRIIAVYTDRKSQLSVYPNPTKGIIYVSQTDVSDAPIEIINQLGEVVLKSNLSSSAALDLGNLPQGIYVLRTSSGDIQRVAKY